MNLQNNLTWNSHLEIGSKSLLPSLRKCLGALRNIGNMIPQASKNTLARGIITSRLTYLISIWGGATQNLVRKAQRIQNSAARWAIGEKKKDQNLNPHGINQLVHH